MLLFFLFLHFEELECPKGENRNRQDDEADFLDQMTVVHRVLEQFTQQHTGANYQGPGDDAVGLPFRNGMALGNPMLEQLEDVRREKDDGAEDQYPTHSEDGRSHEVKDHDLGHE